MVVFEQIAKAAEDLRHAALNLESYISARAEEIAAPRIARAKQAADERVAEVERQAALDRQRWGALEAELRRCIASLERQRDRLLNPTLTDTTEETP